MSIETALHKIIDHLPMHPAQKEELKTEVSAHVTDQDQETEEHAPE